MLPHRRFQAIDLVNLAGALIAIYLGVLLVQTVYHNYQLNRQIETLHGQIGVLNATQQTLKYNVQYYGTSSFQDKQARAKLGLQLPGEGVLILPSPHVSSATPVPVAPTGPVIPKSNVSRWLNFLSGRG